MSLAAARCHRPKKARDMKKTIATLLPLLAFVCACEDFSSESAGSSAGELFWSLNPVIRIAPTKSSAEIPDTNDFILKVTDSAGKVLYEGAYGDSPEKLLVEPGTYSLCVRSAEFTRPEFDRPQYGDDQEVLVKGGESVHVKLMCSQVNSGVRLKTAPDFLTTYPDGVLFLKSAEGRLMYSYTEKRVAYFKAGDVTLQLAESGGTPKDLITRNLMPSEILTLNISAPSAGTNSINIAVDTSKIWTVEDYVIGSADDGSNSGEDTSSAISVSEAASHAGESDVWVYGYIVGGDLTSAGKTVKTSGITKNTHLAIATRSSVTAKASCVAVELPKGAVRDALNLVDHPELIGTRIYLKGNIVSSYFGTVGLKGTSEYQKI